MNENIVKTDLPGYVKDKKNGGVMNTDNVALDAYKKRRQSMREHDNDINALKDEMGEIKTLLKKLLDKKD
tara:strand:+ start:363 stop:572 length:210 start_codon:yes stop_codon:yes gene_type:complete